MLVVLPLLVAHGVLLALFDLTRRPFLTFLALALAFAAYLWACRRLESRVSAVEVLLIAAALRLLLLPLPPTLSDDVLRYAWDGKVVVAGFNPYLLPPEADELSALRDERWQIMPHREVPSVYPPLAMALFMLGGASPQPLLGIKILLCFAELLGCLLLLQLARRLGTGAGRTAWYCWNPLVTLEVAGMGHVDALLVMTLIATVLLLVSTPRRPLAAAVAAAAGVLSKLVPLVALPMWARQSGRPLAFLALAAAVAGVAMLPVGLAAGGVPPGLVRYAVSWEFNGPLYEPLTFVIDRLHVVDAVKGTLDELQRLTDRHGFWNRFYPYVYPELLAKLALGALFLGLLASSFLHRNAWRDPVAASGRLFGAVVICSATVYPWYLLWVLPWAALARHRAWLALSALIQLSYISQITAVPHLPWIFLGIWAPFFVLLFRTRWSVD